MRNRLISVCLVILGASIIPLAGCTVGPDYTRPDTAADSNEGYIYADANSAAAHDFNDIDRWWERFADETSTELVRSMLANNYDLKAAAARVLQAEASLKGAHGQRLPDISYGVSRDRSAEYSPAASGPPFRAKIHTINHWVIAHENVLIVISAPPALLLRGFRIRCVLPLKNSLGMRREWSHRCLALFANTFPS